MKAEEDRSRLIIPAFAFAFPAAFTLRAAVATHAILNVVDPFFAVFGDKVCLLMLVATVTGIALVSTGKVACCAGDIVVFIKREESVVVKGRRLPSSRLVAG